ncbi:alcohol dehydrogenase [Salinadaptatus halalkaliphilus]|uniref:Alcohol dehydrogenase n=1 Tax=Salinadaptatus halalkaliphilus TaxID=2419781 RepID=A0A4S3TRY5_9EURY|nr:alcohol dehydrogenase catalytic domain-containing protein [Salinadaptatus halalkaliphilus]THE66115.1 alcohol dehydrogenase [Salinadaptatus halalkaliphilus]
MKAIVKQGHEKGNVSLADVEKPNCARDEIRLEIQAAGICGSDVGAYLAKPEYEYLSVPGILGHECAGVVETVGTDVETVEPGDRVVLQPGKPCGSCYQCRTGEPNNCPDREPAVAAGGFAPLVVTKPNQVIPVPDDVPIEHAAITEPLAVTHRAVEMKANVGPGDSVLVQGPGPMGAFSALIADAAGGDVVLTGLPDDETRLEALAGLDIETITVDPDTGAPSPATLAERYTSRRGFDVAIDATGVSVGVETAIDATRDGGTVVVVGIPSSAVSIEMAELVRSEIDLRTSHGSVAENFYQALELLQPPNALPVGSIIDAVDPREPTEAFEAFVKAETIKPVFEIDRLELLA